MVKTNGKMSDEAMEEFLKIRGSIGWEVVQEIINDIMKQECDIESVDKSLPPVEYKAEVLGRLKAKEMFTQVFDGVEYLETTIRNKQKDYS